MLRRAKSVQARRSGHAKAIDSQLKAPKARSVDQWLNAPNRFDLPTVDTNKPQKVEAKSCRISDAEYDKQRQDFDRFVDKDDVSDNLKNIEAYNKILQIFENEKIPYHIGKQRGVYIAREDFEKADKLTDHLNKILKKTS